MSTKSGAGASPDSFVAGADIEHLIHGRVGDPEYFADVFDDLAKALFAGAQVLFGALALQLALVYFKREGNVHRQFVEKAQFRLDEDAAENIDFI